MDTLVNTKIGHLLCIEELPSKMMNDGKKYLFVKVKCDCGNATEVRKASFKKGGHKYCSKECPMKTTKYANYIGKIYHSYTIIEISKEEHKQKGVFVLAQCTCGNKKEIQLSQLTHGHVKCCRDCSNISKRISIEKGTRFDMLTMLSSFIDDEGFTQVLCRCDCGNEKTKRLHYLTKKKKKDSEIHSCGCIHKMNLIGKRFGRLTVIKEAEPVIKQYNGKKNTKRRWICECECGTKEKIVNQNELTQNETKSCGCLLSFEERSKRISGENNPMYGITGKENPRWDPERSHEERVKKRKEPQYYIWRKSIYERDKYTCKCCGDNKGGNLVAHHIYNYKDFPKLRYDVSNGITLCTTCHEMYHSVYGKKNNTYEQFEEFLNTFFVHDSYIKLNDILGDSKCISEGIQRLKPYKVILPNQEEEFFYTYDEIKNQIGIPVCSSLKSVLHNEPFKKRKIVAKKQGKIKHSFSSFQEAGRFFNCSGSTISSLIHQPRKSEKLTQLNEFVFEEITDEFFVKRIG